MPYFSTSFETNDFSDFTATGGSPTIVTTHPFKGTYEMKISNLVSTTAQYATKTFFTNNFTGPLYLNFYTYFETFPTANNVFLKLNDSGSTRINLTVGVGGVIGLYDEDSQIGSNTPGITSGQYHLFELYFDLTQAGGNHIVWLKVDGVYSIFAANRNISTGIIKCDWCGNGFAEAQTQGVWYFDSIVVDNYNNHAESFYLKQGFD